MARFEIGDEVDELNQDIIHEKNLAQKLPQPGWLRLFCLPEFFGIKTEII